MERIKTLLSDHALKSRIDEHWDSLTADLEKTYEAMPGPRMKRTELSFHNYIKLLGYLAMATAEIDGDIVEIGVWKGKSLALMRHFSPPSTRVIGVDPCTFENQQSEIEYFQERLFPETDLIVGFSQEKIADVLNLSRRFKILHIDGGHKSANVWMDFLIYERFVVSGGYLVFDDYADRFFSPEVGPAVDRMRELGLFAAYDDIGPVPDYENTYLLRRT